MGFGTKTEKEVYHLLTFKMKKYFAFLFMFFFVILSAQSNFSFKKNIVSANYYYATAENFMENGVQISYFRRSKIEENIHIEYGANIYFSGNKNALVYIKYDSIYYTKTLGINFDFGLKMVKTKRIRNLQLEWTSELLFGAICFDREDIPKTEYKNSSEQENTIKTDLGIESLSTFNVGQGLRFFKKNIGAEIKVNYLPIHWTEKKHLSGKMNMFRFSFGVVYNL